MKQKYVILTTSLIIFTGCSQSMHLCPIRGPITSNTSIHIIKVAIYPFISGGRVHLVLPDGELCRGKWNDDVAVPGAKSIKNNLANIWDAVYGQGYFISHVAGNPDHGHALLSARNGTKIQMDFLHPFSQNQATIKLVGVAVDNHGNVFKIVP